MEGQGGGGCRHRLGNAPRGKPLGPRLHQRAKDGKPRLLGERGKQFDRLIRFHDSRIVELIEAVKWGHEAVKWGQVSFRTCPLFRPKMGTGSKTNLTPF